MVDLKRVAAGGPWSFDNHLLLLHHLQKDEIPDQVSFVTTTFWIQIHTLPTGYMSEAVGKRIGSFIGSFLEYGLNNSSLVWRKYMRIKVAIDVCLPLACYKMIKKRGEHFCSKFLDANGGEVKREWSIDLRTHLRRQVGQNSARWLRSDDGKEEGDWFGNPNLVMESRSRADFLGSVFGKVEVQKDSFVANPDFANKGKSVVLAGGPDSTLNLTNEYLGLEIAEDRKRKRGLKVVETHKSLLCPLVDKTMEVDDTSTTV
ncbi:hypothetical protein PTKIN_Ptkin06aG0078500 [Pterospermum kingtungense]